MNNSGNNDNVNFSPLGAGGNKETHNPFLSGTGENIFLGKEGFVFEEDFVEDKVRCIPMIVRFKMDLAGIKLKLAEWSKFEFDERKELAKLPCITNEEIVIYRTYLQALIKHRTANEATDLPIDENPLWADMESVPAILVEKAAEYNWQISVTQWRSVSNLQRFVLLKLCRPGHENKNFPKAIKEFGLG